VRGLHERSGEDRLGRPIDRNHDGVPGGDVVAIITKTSVTIASVKPAARMTSTASAVDSVLRTRQLEGCWRRIAPDRALMRSRNRELERLNDWMKIAVRTAHRHHVWGRLGTGHQTKPMNRRARRERRSPETPGQTYSVIETRITSIRTY
jgi:hypothetical protein